MNPAIAGGGARRDQRTDAALLTAVAGGDPAALGPLFDRHHADLYRMLGRCLPGRPHDIDDVVQLVFLELPKIAGSFDGRESCRGWLYGVAVRLAFRRRRSFARFTQLLGAFGETVSGGTARDPESLAAGNEELRNLERAMRELGEKKRAAFVLVELEGLAIDDAARALGIPPATVRTRLFHARNELRDAMGRGGEL